MFAAVSLETVKLSHVMPQVQCVRRSMVGQDMRNGMTQSPYVDALQVLVVAPTREIAVQISGVIRTVGTYVQPVLLVLVS